MHSFKMYLGCGIWMPAWSSKGHEGNWTQRNGWSDGQPASLIHDQLCLIFKCPTWVNIIFMGHCTLLNKYTAVESCNPFISSTFRQLLFAAKFVAISRICCHRPKRVKNKKFSPVEAFSKSQIKVKISQYCPVPISTGCWSYLAEFLVFIALRKFVSRVIFLQWQILHKKF